jgi:site-specific recombinase XerD
MPVMKVSIATNHFMVYGRVERQYAIETQMKHRDCFQSWILPFFGEREIEEVGRFDILHMRESMVAQELSSARQSSVLATWKVLLGFARSVLKLNCADPGEIRLPCKEVPNPVVVPLDELQHILECLNPKKWTDLRLRTLCEVLMGTGLRISEALSLDRIPFDRGITEVDIVGKGAKRRTAFFSDRAIFWIKEFLNSRADNHPALFITTGSPARRWARYDASKHFARLRRISGYSKKLTPHILRHTYCTTLRNNGVDISLIKELAGHSDIETTARYYLGVDKPVLRRAIKDHLHYDSPPVVDNKSDSPYAAKA